MSTRVTRSTNKTGDQHVQLHEQLPPRTRVKKPPAANKVPQQVNNVQEAEAPVPKQLHQQLHVAEPEPEELALIGPAAPVAVAVILGNVELEQQQLFHQPPPNAIQPGAAQQPFGQQQPQVYDIERVMQFFITSPEDHQRLRNWPFSCCSSLFPWCDHPWMFVPL